MLSAVPIPPFRFVYQDESGDVGRRYSNFIVGLLLVRDVEPLRAAVKTARAEFHFENELHFVKMSALRERVYKATFEALATVRGEFEFHAILVRHEHLQLGWVGGQRHLAYNFFTKLLLQRHAPRIEQATIFADEKARLKEDNFLQYLPSELNLEAGRYVVRHVIPTDSKSDDVLQVADLLTGCANVLATGTGGRKGEVYAEAVRLGVFDPASLWDWRP